MAADATEVVGKEIESPTSGSPITKPEISNGNTAVVTTDSHNDDQNNGEERDDFGLPVKTKALRSTPKVDSDSEAEDTQAYGTPQERQSRAVTPKPVQSDGEPAANTSEMLPREQVESEEPIKLPPTPAQLIEEEIKESNGSLNENSPVVLTDAADRPRGHAHHVSANAKAPSTVVSERPKDQPGPFSEHSHQVLAPKKEGHEERGAEEEEWKVMPAFAPYDMYDDDDRLFAREEHESDNEDNAYSGLGGAGKGYTRVQVDEDAKSATSMDENTGYLFKQKSGTELHDEDEDQRDPLAQLQATKTLLSETQRIAYVGMTRLAVSKMVKDLEDMESTKKIKKEKAMAEESMKMWSQKMMVRLYGHMDISSSEQIMIEQLPEHGVEMGDMTPALMHNARVKNPMAEEDSDKTSKDDVQSGSKDDPPDASKDDHTNDAKDNLQDNDKDNLKDSSDNNEGDNPKDNVRNILEKDSNKSVQISADASTEDLETHTPDASPSPPKLQQAKRTSQGSDCNPKSTINEVDDPVPEYSENDHGSKPEDLSPAQLGTGENIDIDLRWTVLCDLFLVLLIDSNYDARSRTLLERAGEALQVSWIEISRFEKRVTDSLEMQETANKETWDEAEHLENRRKLALRRRYLMMGLATVGGSLVIGLSAGALAPVIGAGLAAGFTTIGVTGTSAALTGAGASALITTGAVGIGGSIGMKASHRRTGAVKTFEYRPLHNNKRVNLIVTISGWMSSKVDDVRLPFSTVDPVMGDIYSVLWEPEMLTSMGDTINILASEALTQTIQQVLGSTILITLMAAIQLPIVLSKLSYLIDNPWTVSMGRANAAGLILADSLIDRNLGTRPITLVGFSLGARVIFACLRELSNRGAYGIIQNVYLFGSPIIANKDEYCRARSIVSGRFVNGYATNDWILGYLFRATGGGIMRVAGLAKVEGVKGIENIDVTEFVKGHMAYRTAMPKILRRIGWEVESDEFAEIEDPDPENHAARQRELIKEIDEARKAAEGKPQKKRFGFFNMNKVTEKKKWEIYNEKSKAGEDDFSTVAADGQMNVLFDIEAIKKELASEQIDVRQLESTLPPIKLSVDDFKGPDDTQRSQPNSPYLHLRETKSQDGATKSDTPSKFVSFFRSSKSSDPSLPTSRENPFNKGYDDYNFSSETAPGVASAGQGKMSLEDLERSSLKHSPHLGQSSPGLLPGVANADQGKISFEDLESSSPKQSPHLEQGSPGLPPASPLRQEIEQRLSPKERSSQESATAAPATSSRSPPVLEHNAWASEEDNEEQDAEFGKEKEISMTFG